TPNGENPDPLPPPTNFVGSYDENSGVVDMSWSRVTDLRLLKYGIRRLDSAVGGPLKEITATDTSASDVPFSRTDSVQFKKLTYTVYSLKRDPGGYLGASRSQIPLILYAKRPWAYGARIDSLAPVDSLHAYQVGDTVRIAAAWTNRLGENDSL